MLRLILFSLFADDDTGEFGGITAKHCFPYWVHIWKVILLTEAPVPQAFLFIPIPIDLPLPAEDSLQASILLVRLNQAPQELDEVEGKGTESSDGEAGHEAPQSQVIMSMDEEGVSEPTVVDFD